MMQTELVWLVGAVARGDEAAFERLYDATRAKLYGVLLRILGKPALAEEVMQETYLKVWKMADHFDPATARPITWMVGATAVGGACLRRTRAAESPFSRAIST